MEEPTLITPHIERCARSMEHGYSNIQPSRAANIMRLLATERDALANDCQILLAQIDYLIEASGESLDREDAEMVAAIRSRFTKSV